MTSVPVTTELRLGGVWQVYNSRRRGGEIDEPNDNVLAREVDPPVTAAVVVLFAPYRRRPVSIAEMSSGLRRGGKLEEPKATIACR
jgi:hypothetical protein